jgi:hypothetical protein
MSEIRDVGVICINGEIRGECRNCLWLEWDPINKTCANRKSSVCHLQQEETAVFESQAILKPFCFVKG